MIGPKSTRPRWAHPVLAFLIAVAWMACAPQASTAESLARQVAEVQPKIVKIYGAGGVRGLEAYQSGFLVSAEGHVLTVWSYVLDSDVITVTLDDGQRFEAELLGADPQLEIAVLKLPVEDGEAGDFPHFDLSKAIDGRVGNRVLAFSNLYGVATGDESASVQRGVVSAVARLNARRGTFKTPYTGPVYALDAMTNNPGAAGGALTTLRGELLGMLGKELRNSQDNTWLNYAMPIAALREAVQDIRAGKRRPRRDDSESLARRPVNLKGLGVLLVPELIDSTPPFVDSIRSGSSAAKAGLRSDDLILFVNNILVQSLDDLVAECRRIERHDEIHLTVRRGDALKVIVLTPEDNPESRP